jgi:hypothetical protein
MLVRLVCPRPLLFCSIALDDSKQKKIAHMVRIQLCRPTPKCNVSTGNPRWSTFCQDLKHKPSSLSDTFLLAHPDYYPNIREIFHILLTMPIGSVPCERSFSALSRLKQWNRTTMVEDRLNGLAL